MQDLDVAFQAPGTAEPGNDFYHDFVVGLGHKWSWPNYRHLVSLFGLDPRQEPALVRAAAKHYLSDSTYLDNIWREAGRTEVLVYRKTKPASVTDTPRPAELEYVMWRREQIKLVRGRINAVVLKEMNQHLF